MPQWMGWKVDRERKIAAREKREAFSSGRAFGKKEAANSLQQTKHEIKMCEECGIHPVDDPSELCCGCNSYREHF